MSRRPLPAVSRAPRGPTSPRRWPNDEKARPEWVRPGLRCRVPLAYLGRSRGR